jgi:ribonuclease P protein component
VGVRLATLKTRADFLRVAACRTKAVTPGLILQAAPRPTEGLAGSAPRVGFTASRKVGNAVVRNRAKRRLRAAAVQLLADQGSFGTDYVLIARSGTASRPYQALLDDLAAALRRIGRSTTGTPAARRAGGLR